MIGLNKKTTYRKKNSFMNDFTKNMAQALFNQDKLNELPLAILVLPIS